MKDLKNMLDPQVRAFYGDRLDVVPDAYPSAEQMRRDADAVFNDKEKLVKIYQTEDHTVCGPGGMIPVRIYRPFPASVPAKAGKALPLMLYFHGGGFIMHNIASHDSLCRKLALDCGCIVISVGYRLAPEHPYPACIEDGFAALEWTSANAAGLGGSPDRLIAAGDSAGASISAALSLICRQRRQSYLAGFPSTKKAMLPRIALQILCYGSFGCIPDGASESVRLFGNGGFVLPRPMMDHCMTLYRPQAWDPQDQLLYPGRAADLSDLPRTLSVTAECDPLRDDGEAFARRLAESGNQASLYRVPGMMHGFLLYWHKFRRAQEVIARIAQEVRDTFQ